MKRLSIEYMLLCCNKNIFLAAGVFCFFLNGCATTDPFANLEEWKAIQSKHFIVYTNAKETVATDIVKEFEAFRTTALKITTVPPFEEPDPVRIYLFKDKKSFEPFKPSENTGGYFISGKNYIALYAIPFEENPQFPIVYHEFIHYLISKHPAKIPRWYDEGLATLFETFTVEDGVVTFGKAQYHRWLFLKRHASWIPMDEFLSDQVNYQHNKGFTHAHSQAWALMHYFLYAGHDTMEKLGRYIYLLNNDQEYDIALQAAFGLTPEELLHEVKNYIASKNLPYSRLRIDTIAIDDHHHIRSLKADEAHAVIQKLKALVDTFRDAQ
ncbi:MAG: DUF1570 domain-containing protein [Nitrosomonas sp.]|nr:DUF1570 domain-containing protein [Nitrosomonas sp.]